MERGNSQRQDREGEMKLEMAASLLLPSTREIKIQDEWQFYSNYSFRYKIACQFLTQ